MPSISPSDIATNLVTRDRPRRSDLAAEQQGVNDGRNFCETPDAPTPMLSIPRFDQSQIADE